ncbi:MAG: hypothetical protein ACKVHE_34410 [Planctomycetales bacterium]|jgi:hypothetical protein
MARFTLMLFVACTIGTGFASAFDQAPNGKDPLKDATPDEFRAKIKELELEVAHLKSEQRKQAAQPAAIPVWWNLTTTRNNQALPVPPQLPPGLLDLPQFHGLGGDGSQYPATRNASRNPISDMPNGTTARQFNGMTIYNVPCVLRTVNGVPEYAGPAASQPIVVPTQSQDWKIKRLRQFQPYPQGRDR